MTTPSESTAAPERRLAWRAAAVAAVVAIVAVGSVLLSGEAPVAESGTPVLEEVPHVHAGDPISAQDRARLDASGYDRLPGPDNMWTYAAPQPDVDPIDGPALLREVRGVVEQQGWDRRDAAVADGFGRLSEISDAQHYFHRANLDDGRLLDPTAPESLVYDSDGRLLAVMFMVPAGTHGPPVDGFDTAWHVHAVGLCFGPDRMMPTVLPDDGRCPEGEEYLPWSAEMLHVWMVGEPFAQRMSL